MIPSTKTDKMRKECPLIPAPGLEYMDSSTAIVPVLSGIRRVATGDAGADPIKKAPTVCIIRADVSIFEIGLDPVACLLFSASIAPGRNTLPQIVEIYLMGLSPTGALDPDEVLLTGAVFLAKGAEYGKLAEPVSNARERVLSLEASVPAGVQVSWVLIK